MGSLIELPGTPGPDGGTESIDPMVTSRSELLLAATAVLAPVVVALLLTPWRQRLAAADNALVLVVVIVAVATAGRRWAAALCAMAAALSFDFFLTRPYLSLRITRTSDLVTEILLLVVGLSVGDLAARGRYHRTTAREGHDRLAVLHSVTELTASGVIPEDVVRAAAGELRGLVNLRSCTFSADGAGVAARLHPNGEVRIGDVAWSTEALGLPHRGVDLPVRAGGTVLGHFILIPTPGVPVAGDVLLVALAIADQVGASMASAPESLPSLH